MKQDVTLNISGIDTSTLNTKEAREAFELRVEQITLDAKANILNALREEEAREKEFIAREKAAAVAFALKTYEEAGIPEDKAWELVKHDAMMQPIACIGGFCT